MGCVMYELAALVPPFSAPRMELLLDSIVARPQKDIPWYGAKRDVMSSTYSKQLGGLIGRMLEKRMERRPFMDEILGEFSGRFAVERPIDTENLAKCATIANRKSEKKSGPQLRLERDFTLLRAEISADCSIKRTRSNTISASSETECSKQLSVLIPSRKNAPMIKRALSVLRRKVAGPAKLRSEINDFGWEKSEPAARCGEQKSKENVRIPLTASFLPRIWQRKCIAVPRRKPSRRLVVQDLNLI